MNSKLKLVWFSFLALLAFPAASFALEPFTISEELTVVSPSALTFNATINSDVGSDSDSDNSSLSGAVTADFSADFSSGNLTISDFTFTGGQVVVDNDLSLDFTLGGFLVDIDADGTGFAGVPTTFSPPSTLSPSASPGTIGQFPASDGIITIDQGNIHVVVSPLIGSDTIIDLDLADTPIEGASTSVTPGTVTVVQGAIDVEANTTTYSLVLNLPVEFDSPPIDLDGQGTAQVSVAGTVRASVAEVVLDFIPWNGIVGDVNQDGVISTGSGNPASDDVLAFIDGWLATDLPLGREGIKKGDLNLDGTTNLADAFLLHQALQGSGAGGLNMSLFASNQVPEPGSMILASLAAVGLITARRLRRR